MQIFRHKSFDFMPFFGNPLCQCPFLLLVFRAAAALFFALYLSCALYNILYLLAFVLWHIEMTDIISLRKFVQPTAHI